jgi:hypothetical protein
VTVYLGVLYESNRKLKKILRWITTIFTLHQALSGRSMKEGTMRGACSTNGEFIESFIPTNLSAIGRPKRWEDNIQMELTEKVCESIWLWLGTIGGLMWKWKWTIGLHKGQIVCQHVSFTKLIEFLLHFLLGDLEHCSATFFFTNGAPNVNFGSWGHATKFRLTERRYKRTRDHKNADCTCIPLSYWLKIIILHLHPMLWRPISKNGGWLYTS